MLLSRMWKTTLRLCRRSGAGVHEVLRLLALYPRYVFTDAMDFLRTLKRYYPNAQFRRADWRFLLAYLFRDADKICVRHVRHLPDDQVQKIWGETFFSTLDDVARAVRLNENDVMYELGCGRGRGVFWLNAFHGCRVVGVEINPVFMKIATRIRDRVQADGVEFITANLLDLDYSPASVIYLYGTAFSDAALRQLMKRFATLRPGARVASVSARLGRYSNTPLFELEQTIQGKFLWGRADIFIYRRI